MAGHTAPTAAPPTTVITHHSIIGDLAARYRTLALDGCDGTGKTTLATHLATQHGFRVIHSTRTPDGLNLTVRYRDLLTSPGPIVLDRCFVAELVYGPLRHGRSRLTLADARLLAAVVGARDGAMLHLTGTPATIHHRLLDRDGQHALSLTEVEHLITAYDRVFAALADTVTVIRIDTTTNPADDPAQAS